MTVFTAIALTAFLFENDNRIIACLLDDFRRNFGAGNSRRADFFTEGKHIVKCHSRADLCIEFFNDDHIIFCDLILLAACLNNCEHFLHHLMKSITKAELLRFKESFL